MIQYEYNQGLLHLDVYCTDVLSNERLTALTHALGYSTATKAHVHHTPGQLGLVHYLIMVTKWYSVTGVLVVCSVTIQCLHYTYIETFQSLIPRIQRILPQKNAIFH